MTDRKAVFQSVAKLRAEFVRSKPYELLWEQFDRQWQRRQAALASGAFAEARGIVITGASGSGKSTLVNRLLTQYPEIRQPKAEQNDSDVISLLAPSPATLKYVGSTMLGSLGFPLVREKSAGFIWDQVRELLMRRRTFFVHLDEAQDLFSSKSLNARNDVLNTLKSLMNNRDWPVGLILSGTPSMIEMINADDQLKRRIDIVSIDPITWGANGRDVEFIFRSYLEKAEVELCPGVSTTEFVPRLIHAGANELGLTIELILNGVEDALLGSQSVVKLDNFSAVFARKSGCIPGLNPFIADDYLSIDPRAVLGRFQLGGGDEDK